MIERIDDAPASVLAFKAVGEVGLDDYDSVVKPALDAALTGRRKLRAVVVIGPEFTGYAKGVRPEDLGLGLGFIRKVERVAVVTDVPRIDELLRRYGWMLRKRVKRFSLGEQSAAMRWVAGE